MPIIRCTKKLQREMGLRPADLSTEAPDPSPLGAWYANLLYIDRRKCVLFTNDRTLFNFIVPGVKRADIRKLDQLFLSWLPCVLKEEALPGPVVEQIMAESARVVYGSASDRSVLGSMNDLAFHYKFLVHDAGGVHSAEVPGIIRELNHMPMRALQFVFPVEELKALYGIDRNRS